MKRFWVFVKTHLLIITIVFIALLLRIIWLDRFPISLTGDELVYIFSAKLFILESSYLHGWNPLQAFVFRYPPGVFPQAELPYLIALLTVHLLRRLQARGREPHGFAVHVGAPPAVALRAVAAVRLPAHTLPGVGE